MTTGDLLLDNLIELNEHLKQLNEKMNLNNLKLDELKEVTRTK